MWVIEIFRGMGKKFRVRRYAFFIYLKVASKQGAPEPYVYNYLLRLPIRKWLVVRHS